MGVIAGPSITPRKALARSLFGGDVPTLLYSDPALGGDGCSRINPDKIQAKWKWIAATYQGATPMNFGSGTVLTQQVMIATIPPSKGAEYGDFEVVSLLCRAYQQGTTTTTSIAIQPYVKTPTVNRFLSNQPIPQTLIAGASQLPGQLLQAIYCLPKSSWEFRVQGIGATVAKTVEIALFGRQFVGCSPCDIEGHRTRAQWLQWFHPYWIGPQDPAQPTLTGPEVTIPAGSYRWLTFPIPDNADFLMFGMLDNSTDATGADPGTNLVADVRMNVTAKGLIDLPATSSASGADSTLGIPWRDFLAIPTVQVTGFPQTRVFASGLAPNQGGWSHLVPRNTQFMVRFTNLDATNAQTIRAALFGLLVYGRQPGDRQTSVSGAANRERIAQGEEFLRRLGLESGYFGEGRPR